MYPFEKYFSPHTSNSSEELIKVIELVKEMGVFWRGCIEDLSQSNEVSYLHIGVTIKLYESMKNKELELDNRVVEQEHLLALAFEEGLSGIAEISPEQIREYCMDIGKESVNIKKIEKQIMELIYGFAESSPDPFPYETYKSCFSTIHNWVKLIKSEGLPDSLVIGDITGRL